MACLPTSREYRWVWSGLVWQREPALEQLELESWIGNTPGAVPSVQATGPSAPGKTPGQSPAASSNQYLYSTLGDPQPLHVYTISRARLVLFASLPLLLAGLLLIYVPATRHPGVLFTGAVAVAAVALIDPESALLVGQAAVLGLCLAGVAYALARMSLRPTPPRCARPRKLARHGTGPLGDFHALHRGARATLDHHQSACADLRL